MRHDYHPPPVANQRLLVFEFLELNRGALPRRADQVRQILVRKLERQQHPARVLDAKFIADLQQRAGQPFAQPQADEARVPHQHHPPSAHRYVKHPAQEFALDAERGFDEDLRLHDGNRAIGKRIASKRPDGIRQQRRNPEDLAGSDQTHQHAVLAIEDRQLRDAREHDVDAVGGLTFRENSVRASNPKRFGTRREPFQLLDAHPRQRPQTLQGLWIQWILAHHDL